jgi:hypothetical protein
MKAIFRIAALLIVAISFYQCQREVSFVGKPNTENTNPDPINAVLQGNILDETGQPAAGVSIKVGSKTALTDAHGYFRIMNAALDKKASLVTAEKSGYFKAYRTFGATAGANQVVMKLMKKTLAGTVIATSGGTVTLSNGGKIDFPANGVVLASGGSYSGTFNVYASYIDPTASDIGQTVPGSFMANDKNNNRVSLKSYGMMAVELESATGEKLQIKSGSVATLSTPIPSGVQASAPASISMWYVDEQTGLWKEEGSASKNGSNYVGDVKHFTYWNCDISLPAVTLSFTINTPSGLPLPYAHVSIVVASGNSYGSAHGYTDSLGQVNGLIPANTSLVMYVYDNCANTIYTQNIGPFSQNTSLGTIVLNSSASAHIINFSGKLLNCSGNPVTDGYAIINIDNFVRYAATDAAGNFLVPFSYCGSASSAIVFGVDETGNQQSTAASIPIVSPATNAGIITTCGVNASQFVNYTLDGTSHSINNTASDSLIAFSQPQGGSLFNTTITASVNTAGSSSLFLTFSSPNTAGTYQAISLSVQTYNNTTLIQPFNVVVTNFALAVGDFYEGSFSGQFKDAANVTHNISGNFRLRKQW